MAAVTITDGIDGGDCGIGSWCGWSWCRNLANMVRPGGATCCVWPVAHLEVVKDGLITHKYYRGLSSLQDMVAVFEGQKKL